MTAEVNKRGQGNERREPGTREAAGDVKSAQGNERREPGTREAVGNVRSAQGNERRKPGTRGVVGERVKAKGTRGAAGERVKAKGTREPPRRTRGRFKEGRSRWGRSSNEARWHPPEFIGHVGKRGRMDEPMMKV